MELTWKDGAATVLTGLAVVVYLASSLSWDAWLIGSSTRWAAAVVLLLGIGACSLGRAGDEIGGAGPRRTVTKVLSGIGIASLAFGLWAIVTGSETALALLLGATVVLWAASTLRHVRHPTHTPVAA